MKEVRYPAGKILYNSGFMEEAESIEQQDHGVFYFPGSTTESVFVPYTSVERIVYDEIPKEIRDEAQAAAIAREAKKTNGKHRPPQNNSIPTPEQGV